MPTLGTLAGPRKELRPDRTARAQHDLAARLVEAAAAAEYRPAHHRDDLRRAAVGGEVDEAVSALLLLGQEQATRRDGLLDRLEAARAIQLLQREADPQRVH